MIPSEYPVGVRTLVSVGDPLEFLVRVRPKIPAGVNPEVLVGVSLNVPVAVYPKIHLEISQEAPFLQKFFRKFLEFLPLVSLGIFLEVPQGDLPKVLVRFHLENFLDVTIQFVPKLPPESSGHFFRSSPEVSQRFILVVPLKDPPKVTLRIILHEISELILERIHR